MSDPVPDLGSIVQRYHARAPAGEIAVALRGAFGDQTAAAGTWRGQAIDADTPFALASASKLFGTAMTLALADRGALDLDDPITRFFPAGLLDGLHRRGGRDRTDAITVGHLLSHRSGLPDYFGDRRSDGHRFEAELMAGQDRGYDFDDVLRWSRDQMAPRFAPGTGRKAHYSDTNFYLLGEIIARVAGENLDAALARFVTGPLGLARTGFFHPGIDHLPLRNGTTLLSMPRALAAMPVDGGGISTAREMAIFAQAFFAGRLFDPAWLPRLMDFRPIFFPLEAGVGIVRFRLPWIVNLVMRQPALIGHTGISGGFAFALPDRGLVIAGTTNQLADRSRPFRLALEIAGAVAKATARG